MAHMNKAQIFLEQLDSFTLEADERTIQRVYEATGVDCSTLDDETLYTLLNEDDSSDDPNVTYTGKPNLGQRIAQLGQKAAPLYHTLKKTVGDAGQQISKFAGDNPMLAGGVAGGALALGAAAALRARANRRAATARR